VRLTALVCLSAAACAPQVHVDDEALRRLGPRTLAVVPFTIDEAEAGPRGALYAAAVRTAVQERLASLPYLHLELAEIDRSLARGGEEALGVDVLVRGRLSSLTNLQGGLIYRQVIEGELEMVGARDGKLLARVTHSEADTGGLLLNYGQAVEAVQQTIDNSSDVGFLRLAERFAERVVKALPPPPTRVDVEQPVIEAVELRAPRERPLGVGDHVDVLVRATPGLEAAFDLGHGIAEVPLVEEEPGRYRGWYRVALGDRMDEPPSVHVSDRWGVGAQQVLRDDPLRVEARPPAAPASLALRPLGDGRALLTWVACAEAARYRVYAIGARGIPVLLTEVAATEAAVSGEHRRYGVAGLDAQGDLGVLALFDLPGGS
jgi:hypothetical protein